MRKKIAISFLVIALISCFLFSYRIYLTKKQLAETKVEIEELTTYQINGYNSKALIRGTNNTNPVLLFVHGLGYPDMMFTRCYDQGLLDEFTVVHYDQRGMGKSRSRGIRDSTLKIENYVSDLLSITDSIHTRFPASEIYLLGQSWGTILGLTAIHKAPEKYACYIGIAQIVYQKEADLISYDFALNKARELKNEDMINSLTELSRERYNQNPESLSLQRKCLKELGGNYCTSEVLDAMKKCVIRSPEHGLIELLLTPNRAKKIDELLFSQILEVNFFETIRSIEKPVFIIGGRHDYMVPSVLSQKYLDSLEAPAKEYIWFEKSGHLPIFEENKKFKAELQRIKENLQTILDG